MGWIAHIDMDAFFVAVELLRRPELRGQPVVVARGTDPTARGVVTAASYEARRFGVHSALPLSVAHRRCPDMVLVPGEMPRYRTASAQVMEVLRGFSDRVEVAGLDEAYIDLSASPAPKARARQIKRDVRAATGLVCSVGLAPNKLMAKIASDLDKPDGFAVLDGKRWLATVGDRPASLIPGVGPKTSERLGRIGIRTIAELAAADDASLRGALGPTRGAELRARARGQDARAVVSRRAPKSESRETTFPHDVTDPVVLGETLARLARAVGERLAGDGYRGRTITLKIRLRPFRTYTRSRTLTEATDDAGTIAAVAADLLAAFEVDAPVRLIGVGVAGLLDRRAGERERGSADESAEPRQLRLPAVAGG